ncbi:MAG: acyl-CoA/acyl-ACP dehydrogenase [Planctomycetaceae bacterium]|jgi:alkylation response protein AidB-like acyl-CoA dehydrogenase|nr:acyl-CoA/acyl-ACP dehydrogenase [Planctomycetaceae bacterium]
MPDNNEPIEIRSPEDPTLSELCKQLHELSVDLDFQDGNGVYPWPQKQLELCAQYGVFRWFLEPEHGGLGWSDYDLTLGYLALSAACQTTTFVITQRTGACRRIALSGNDFARDALIPALLDGSRFSTVGISHLTTSRRHLTQAVLRAEETETGFLLNGFSPWVTGGVHADTIVVGAQLEDGRQILTVVPTGVSGVHAEAPANLVALSGSHTGKISLVNVQVDRKWLLAGPVENVMAQGIGARTGGLQTSTLAIGLAGAAIDFIFSEGEKRPDLLPPAEALKEECESLREILLHSAAGNETCGTEELRQHCNSLVLRSTQAALSAAKGMGFVTGHPVGRWCREALFFMVWSCPQPVVNAQMCQLAGIAAE